MSGYSLIGTTEGFRLDSMTEPLHSAAIPVSPPRANAPDENKPEVALWVEQVRHGDEAAARALVEHLYPLVIRIVRAKLPRLAAEEDLMQEIFLKVFTRIDQYEGAVPFEHWVSRIAVNHSLNALRAQKSRPEWRQADLTEQQAEVFETVLTSSAEEPHPAEAMAARELVEKLFTVLDPEDRLIMTFLEMEDRSVEEVQQMTGWSKTRIRVRAFRARRKLNKHYARLKKEGVL